MTEAFGPNLDAQLSSGEVDGFEKNLHIYDVNGTSPLAPYVTANVNRWPQTVALIANPEVVDRLSDQQRGWLMQAGADAAARSTDLVDGDAERLIQLCEVGARFANSSEADLEAFKNAFASVYGMLTQDPQTKKFIEQIEELKSTTDPGPALSVPPGCTGPAPGVSDASPTTSVVTADEAAGQDVDGIYRWTVTEADARANGDPRLVSADFLPWYPMVATMTLDNGTWELAWRGGDGAQAIDGPGTYSVDGGQLVLDSSQDVSMAFTFSSDGDGNLDLEPSGPAEGEGQFLYSHYVWQKIDGGSSADDTSPPTEPAPLNGTYRWTLTEDDALEHGSPSDVTPAALATYPWVFTITMTDGTWALRHRDGDGDHVDGGGPYSVEADRIVFDWGGVKLAFTFTADDRGLQLQPVPPMNLGDQYVWSTKRWEKIG